MMPQKTGNDQAGGINRLNHLKATQKSKQEGALLLVVEDVVRSWGRRSSRKYLACAGGGSCVVGVRGSVISRAVPPVQNSQLEPYRCCVPWQPGPMNCLVWGRAAVRWVSQLSAGVQVCRQLRLVGSSTVPSTVSTAAGRVDTV